MSFIIETQRLILRELQETDLEGMFSLDSDPEVHRFLGNKPITKESQAQEIIQSVRQQYKDNGIGRWAMIEKSSGDFIGWSGLKYITDTMNGHQFFYDLGYRLRRPYWGRGYAKESAQATLNYAFSKLQLAEVFAAASCDNLASNKVLESIGMIKVDTFYYDDILCNWYHISNE